MNRIFPFSELKKGANVLIFPNLNAGNISYKLLQQLGNAVVLGPFLMEFADLPTFCKELVPSMKS